MTSEIFHLKALQFVVIGFGKCPLFFFFLSPACIPNERFQIKPSITFQQNQNSEKSKSIHVFLTVAHCIQTKAELWQAPFEDNACPEKMYRLI